MWIIRIAIVMLDSIKIYEQYMIQDNKYKFPRAWEETTPTDVLFHQCMPYNGYIHLSRQAVEC